MTVTIEFAIALTALLVEHKHFFAFYKLVGNFGYYFGSFNGGSTYRDCAVGVNQKHFVKFNSLAVFNALQMVYEDFLAFFHLKLLTVNLYDCVHFY